MEDMVHKYNNNQRFGIQDRQVSRKLLQSVSNKIYFYCKQSGYFSKDCKQKKKLTCFKCGQEEYISLSCPKRRTSGIATVSHLIKRKDKNKDTSAQTEDIVYVRRT